MVYCKECQFRRRQYHPTKLYYSYRDYCRRQLPEDAFDTYFETGNFRPVECSDRNQNNDCKEFMHKVGFWGWFKLLFWNTRPIEDAKQAEIDVLRAQVKVVLRAEIYRKEIERFKEQLAEANAKLQKANDDYRDVWAKNQEANAHIAELEQQLAGRRLSIGCHDVADLYDL